MKRTIRKLLLFWTQRENQSHSASNGESDCVEARQDAAAAGEAAAEVRRSRRRTEPRERAERAYKLLAFVADVLESHFIDLCMLCMPPLPALFPLTLHPLPKTAAVWHWVRVPAPAYWAPQLVWVLFLCICSCKLFCYISWFCSLDLARTCWMARRCRDWLVIVNGGRRRSGGGARRRGRDILVHWFCSTLLSFCAFP